MSALSCLGVSPRDMASATPTKVHDKLKKGSMDQDEMRRKREATTMQIRKDKKEESIQKRRRDVGGGSSRDASSSSSRRSEQVGALPDPALKIKLDNLPEDMALLLSSDPGEQLEATTRFRKLLSIERNPPIAEVLAAGAVPRLVQFCQCCSYRAPPPSPSSFLCSPHLAREPRPRPHPRVQAAPSRHTTCR